MPGRVPLEETQESNDRSFLQFVEEQIAKMKEYASLGSGRSITFVELNEALCNYEQVYLTLISMYNVINIEFQRATEDFDDWYADKFLSIRSRENAKDMSAQKWASQKELEWMVRKEFNFDYRARKDNLMTLERKVAFFRRLLESWQAQQWILNTLSKNIATEVSAGLQTL